MKRRWGSLEAQRKTRFDPGMCLCMSSRVRRELPQAEIRNDGAFRNSKRLAWRAKPGKVIEKRPQDGWGDLRQSRVVKEKRCRKKRGKVA